LESSGQWCYGHFPLGIRPQRAIRSPTSRREQGRQDIIKVHPWQAEHGKLLLNGQLPSHGANTIATSPKPDLYSNLSVTPTEKRPNPMPLHGIVAECTTMTDAGNDTTRTSLTNLMYPLAANLERQTKVCNELASTLAA